ncbi:acyltransferase family protein [Enterococcus timonensis]|uniref:acyltransferase family protein n=1 Tax=Enterococcus timonensis TaxID=1852364 RepID=UPI0008DAFC49|nr:acyltransferase [Enterococcus timonensis]
MEAKSSHLVVTKNNNFDIIRFFAAILIVWFHSYPLSGTGNNHEFIYLLSRGQMTAGSLGVMIFFVISGLLIPMSYQRTNNVVQFFKARVLRIMPAFIVVILLSAFVLGPLVSDLPLGAYFKHPMTWDYLKNMTLYTMRYNLPGVFTENIYPNAINGSIWTLWYEFFYYIVIIVLGLSKLLRKETSLILYGLCLVMVFLNVQTGYYYWLLGMYFFAGMVFYYWRDTIVLNGKIALAAFVLIIASIFLGHLPEMLSFAGSYLIFFFSLGPVPKLANFSRFGDLSYGIYIYSFIIQQLLMYLFHNQLSQLQNFFFTLPLVMICAYISWHLIEKNCMKLKNKKLFPIRKVDGLNHE